ncbi:glycoside hydrolase family 97 catalytic domain-containing protein [Myceligenerans pegani]|uniref:Glycoside hydrolase family 97 catalytic domain-containing protein n=1 Tax=Myceligenerans pegani TaxID=2776917 RepID=A0ABR9MVF5_9MICO|nr:glycoside hydrolase family 97 catalytic domain-containing protein [Myceligenerans sp. TRM 65318]MBE1875371.1 glycoside hydrolase family 97 catalytic domain-containing protein [Myceligenerans sp. TRM 65318]MBE3017642.1 glycoside hydrolase family 97 catalytic domain-containing protein [Myceligenerans sp. TRM 65318]
MVTTSPRATAPATTQSGPTTRLRLHDGRAFLDVLVGDRPIIQGIAAGIRVDGHDLGSEVSLIRSQESAQRGSWNAVGGKATGPHSYEHRHIVHRFRHVSGIEWQLHVREARDGIALRYAIDGLQGHARFQADLTDVPLDTFDRAWVLDYQTWYETPRYAIDLPADVETGLPVLLRAAGEDLTHPYVLVSESGIDGRFSGAHLRIAAGVARVQLADEDLEVTRGPVTPWRVLVIGGLADVVETRLIDELAPDAAPLLEDVSWVRPGRAAWSWWSDFYSGAQLEHQRRFVDAAAELGWEHLLIDCGWDPVWVPDIVEYASRRGIQVHLWTVWHDLDGPENLRKLALWRSWGVAGIKVDFMESEAKDRYRWYDTILAETARLGLMVNFHGSVIPRGWARTWPQVIGYEAVRGAEYYVFYQGSPLTAAHNVLQPFTRNVVGAMDYTPVAFGAPGRETSDAHELALAVVYECGITHFADDVDAYRSRPEAARLLAELPPTWDETRLLCGDPDAEAVIARRRGDRWYIGAIATGDARALTVPLTRLGDAPWQAWILTDAPEGGLTSDTRDGVGNELDVVVANNGGFAAILAPAGATPFRTRPRPLREPLVVEPAVQTLSSDGSAELRTAPDASLRLEPGWTAERIEPGLWRVRSPRAVRAGQVGVVTVEGPDSDVPVVTHARLVAPLTPGEHALSSLGIVAFENESGPVERDTSNGGGNPGDGARMRIAGKEHDTGLGVSTPSRVVIHLDGGASRLLAEVGIDDETPGTRAVARVLGDGAELATVDLHAGSDPTSIDVDVVGVDVLELVTEPGGGTPAHVDWASGRVVAASQHTGTPGRS